MNLLKKILPLFLVLYFHQAMAQEKWLESYHKAAPIEKLYLHLDRKDYFAGQTSWFKGYFLSDFMPSNHNSTLFVELINNSGTLLVQKILPVFNGITYGQIDIPDTLSTGTYSIRAYTPLMLNQDKDFLYRTSIRVYGKKAKQAIEKSGNSAVSFFPEGGTLLNGVENRIAFKAVNAEGLPESINAKVTDERGKEVATINSMHDGMGSFQLIPEEGKNYSVVWKGLHFSLPKATGSGTALQINKANNQILYSYQSAGGELFSPSYMIGQMQHQVLFKQAVDGNHSGAVNTEGLHSGILQLTFFNKDGMPLAERLVFINNKEYLINAQLNAQQINTKARGKNQFSIQLDDVTEGNFSVSVTDEAFNEPGPRKENIVSSFLLSSDIPGYVHQPAFYFGENPEVEKALDLVMLTNGWRRFSWKDIKEKAETKPAYTDPGYISLSGQVNVRGSKKNFSNRDLLIWVAGSDSSRSLQMVKTDEEGKFKMDSVVFFDKAKVLFSDVMGKKSQFITVKLNTDSLYKAYDIPLLTPPPAANTNTSLQNNMQSAYTAFNRGGGILLDNVNIEGRRLTLEELEKKYMSGLFLGNINARTINLTGQFIPQFNIFEWLMGRVPSLSIQRNGSLGNDYRLSFRQQPVQLFLDEMIMQDANFISSIPPNQIALIKIFPQFVGARGSGAAIAIYTKRGDDLNEEMDASGDIVDYEGYSIIKEFYSPDYATAPDIDYRDHRLTLDWQPEIIASGNQSIPIEFYNTDRTKKFKVVAEGITRDGKLLMIEQTLE